MLQRQDDSTFWQSVTGTLETNETPRETAIREVWEEVGLKIEENLTALFCDINGEVDKTKFLVCSFILFVIYFLNISVLSQNLKLA